MKRENILDSGYSDWVLFIGVVSVFISWFTIFFYLLFVKMPNHPNDFLMENLGQAGDFFNISTSLASFITVLLVYSAYRLQRRELVEMKNQIKKEEKINRTFSFIDKWQEIIKNNGGKKFSQDELMIIKSIIILTQADKDYKNHIDLKSICHILLESGVKKRFSLSSMSDDQIDNIGEDVIIEAITSGIINFIETNASK